MQDVIILETVEIPDTPRFDKGQKVRVADGVADLLVERSLAKYDQGLEAKTAKAKSVKAEKEAKDPKEPKIKEK